MKLLITLFSVLLVHGISWAQPDFTKGRQKADEVLQELVNRVDIVGASIAVGLGDSLLYTKGAGLADKDREVRTQSYHKFRIYSLSKHITAIAAARLAEQGKLDLDAPISTMIPFIDSKLGDITSRQLVGHLAGIRSYAEGEWQVFADASCSSAFEAMLSFQADSLIVAPGEEYNYTSYGYVVLSAVIEKVAGQSFIQHLQQELFLPLGLDNITLDNADHEDHLAAKSYEYWKEVMYNARYANNTCKFGGGGLSASTIDVVRFNLAVLNGKVVNPATQQMIYSSMRLNNGEETDYGFGLQFDKGPSGKRQAWHSGRSRGGRNALVIYPTEKLVVCISANSNGDGIVNEAEAIAEAFLQGF